MESSSVADKAEPVLKPKQVVKRSGELVREAELLLKKKGKKVTVEKADEVRARMEAVKALIPTRKNKVELQPKPLYQAAIALDQGLQTHFGQWRKSQLREFIEAILWALGLAAIIKFFILEAFSIPSSSMYPTLNIGDHLFINKFEFGLYTPFSSKRLIEWGQPDRGDIIVFVYRYPGDKLDGEDYIKRVVALPGDRIRLEDDRIILNGQPIQTEVVEDTTCGLYGTDWVKEPSDSCPCIIQRETIGDETWLSQHIKPDANCGQRSQLSGNWPQEFAPGAKYFGAKVNRQRPDTNNPNWPDLVVPEGHVFVMGDNRDASEDGRFWGFVPFERIKGKAFIVFWPFSRGFDWLD